MNLEILVDGQLEVTLSTHTGDQEKVSEPIQQKQTHQSSAWFLVRPASKLEQLLKAQSIQK